MNEPTEQQGKSDAADDIISDAANLRLRLLCVGDQMLNAAEDFSLPLPEADFYRDFNSLKSNKFRVLFVGEVKRGKSSLANAIIGQDILPTDVAEATCQVFFIQPSEKEDYRLRFEDGSFRTISRDELPTYGSQVVQDNARKAVGMALPQLDKVIRWIEVDYPIRFMPAGVSLLDTPGVGASFPTHTEITHRFIPEADAVIFVLDSIKPITQFELDLVAKILEKTRSILFVQTKIDQFLEEKWRAVAARSEQVMREKFGARLPDPSIWPLSSKVLRMAADNDEDSALYREASKHDAFDRAFQVFLSRLAAWNRVESARKDAEKYRTACDNVLRERAEKSHETSKEKRSERSQASEKRSRDYVAAWSPGGAERKKIEAALETLIQAHHQRMESFLGAEGELETQFFPRYMNFSTLDAFQGAIGKDAASFTNNLAAAVAAKWRQSCDKLCADTLRLFVPFTHASDSLLVGHPLSGSRESIFPFPDAVSATLRDRLRGMSIAEGSVVVVVTALIAGAILPVALVMGVAAAIVRGVFDFFFGPDHSAAEEKLKQGKDALRTSFVKMLETFRDQYLDQKIPGPAQSYAIHMRGVFTTHIDAEVTRKAADLQKEIERDRDFERKDEQSRRAAAKQDSFNLNNWVELCKPLDLIEAQLKRLDEFFRRSEQGI